MVGDDFGELIIVGVVSLLASLAGDFHASGRVRFLLRGVVSIVDVGTLLIALLSLRRTMETLEEEKQSQKQRVMVRLRNVLVGVAGAWMGYCLLWKQNHTNPLNWWMQRWVYEDGVPLLFSTIVLAYVLVGNVKP